MSRAPKITTDYIEKLMQDGRGQGHGKNYKPWLEIKRWNPSSVSTQSIGGLPPFYRRRGTFMSKNEWHVGLVLSWLVTEVREQYPIWPWAHPHPLYGLSDEHDLELPRSVGMLNICDEMGIKHGVFPGTNIPYIWTLDFVLTLRVNDEYRCAVCSVKPVENERYQDPDPLDRAMEKLEAERRYCLQLGILYSITGRDRFDSTLISNLEVFRAAAVLPVTDLRYAILQKFLDQHGDTANEYPLDDWVGWMRAGSGATLRQAIFVIHHILWKQLIDIDISERIYFSRLYRPGGRTLQKKLLDALLEGSF